MGVAVEAGGGVDHLNVGDAQVGVDSLDGAVGGHPLREDGVGGALELDLSGEGAAAGSALGAGGEASAGQEGGSGKSEELHFDNGLVEIEGWLVVLFA